MCGDNEQMTTYTRTKTEYIGDGLYASFDGYQIRVYTQRGGVEQDIYLEPDVYQALVNYGNRCYKINKDKK